MFARTEDARSTRKPIHSTRNTLPWKRARRRWKTPALRWGGDRGDFSQVSGNSCGRGQGLSGRESQVVGPFTLLSGLKDQDGRALLFDERFVDIVPKLLA